MALSPRRTLARREAVGGRGGSGGPPSPHFLGNVTVRNPSDSSYALTRNTSTTSTINQSVWERPAAHRISGTPRRQKLPPPAAAISARWVSLSASSAASGGGPPCRTTLPRGSHAR